MRAELSTLKAKQARMDAEASGVEQLRKQDLDALEVRERGHAAP